MSRTNQFIRRQLPHRSLVAGHPHLSAVRWTLCELLALVVVSSIVCQLAATGSPRLALCLFGFVICTRIAIVDYSPIGSLATALVMIFGTSLIFMATFWTLN